MKNAIVYYEKGMFGGPAVMEHAHDPQRQSGNLWPSITT